MARSRPWLAAVLACALAAGAVSAQDQPEPPVRGPVLTLNFDLLISGSQVGRRMAGDLEAERIEIEVENKRIAGALEAEEIALTQKRDTMSAADFRAAARLFDEKVQEIRAARGALELELVQRRDSLRQTFDAAALPILSEIMREAGAGVILDARSVILSVDQIDVTRFAIARLDAAYPDGRLPLPEGGAESADPSTQD